MIALLFPAIFFFQGVNKVRKSRWIAPLAQSEDCVYASTLVPEQMDEGVEGFGAMELA